MSEVKNKTVFRFQDCLYSESKEDAFDIKKNSGTNKKNLSGIVIKLYDQCMEILSNYTHCFESLVDFPEDFGKEIFEAASSKLSIDNQNTKKSLEIFSEAYPNSFLTQCKLSNMLMINNYELCLPVILTSIVKLDLTNCHLDDEHDLLGQLINLTRLEVLSLSENLLTDKGLRRILLPVIGGKNLPRLVYLDLSYNKLDKKVLSRIRLTNLTTVVFGETDFIADEVEAVLKNCFRLRKCPRFEKIETIGFGRQLLDIWAEKSKVKIKTKPKSEGFYSKPRVATKLDISLTNLSKNKVMYERLVLREVSNRFFENKGSNTIQVTKSVKRKGDEVEAATCKKSNVLNGDVNKTEFEQSLLSLYK